MNQTTTLVGLDLGGTALKAVLLRVGAAPTVVGSEIVETPRAGDPDLVVTALVTTVGRLVADDPITAVGVGIPGQFDAISGTLRALPNVPGPWEGYPLRDRLTAALGLPVHLVNDSQAFTLAEAALGAAVGRRTVLGMTLGTGVGGGVVIEGRIHRGAHGSAGEIGHQVIAADGPVCGCGRRGCLEAMARSAVFASLAGWDTAVEAFDAVRAGDGKAVAALAVVTEHLGVGLANTIAVLDPDIVVVGGGLALAGDLLLDPLRDAVRRHVSMVPPGSTPIVAGTMGMTAGAVGAALSCSA